MKLQQDTIAAISTAVHSSGIAIIRISGKESVILADKIFRPRKKNLKLADVPSHTIHYGWIADGDQIVDEVLVSVMRSPSTYTAEDVVEINCHGGAVVVKKVLDLVLKNGARAANPGEFTKRAFLNGRIDLSRAEAVMNVIQAENEYALQNSVHQLAGSLGKSVGSLRKDILHEIARIESALDDPEHYSLDGYTDTLAQKLQGWKDTLQTMIDTYDNGRMIREGIKTAIIGKPNVGKSSLMNALAKEELAIVTDVAGTTRDLIGHSISLGSISLRIVDTAGIRDTSDVVEKIGVQRAIESAKSADLILYVLDSTEEWDQENEKIISLFGDKKVLVILNKTDLEQVLDLKEARKMTGTFPVLPVSALKGDGLKELEETIEKMFFSGNLSFDNQIVITSARQKQCLTDSLAALTLVEEGMALKMPEDLLTIDLENSVAALGEITGETLKEDLVNEIFDQFCMGK